MTSATAEKAFIADNLTRDNQLTLYKARQLKKKDKIFAAWSDVGKLKIRVRQGGPTVLVRSERDLDALMDPAASGPAAASSAAASTDSDGFHRVLRGKPGGRK